MTIRLYHPELVPPHNECEVVDEGQVAVLAESGWRRVPDPVMSSPAHVPDPVTYAPVELDKPTRGKTARKTEPAD